MMHASLRPPVVRQRASVAALLVIVALIAVAGGATAAVGVALVTVGGILALKRSRSAQAWLALALLAAGGALLVSVALSLGALLIASPR